MTTTTKADGTSGGGRAKAGTITQIIADLREVQTDIRYLRRWMYALSACMVLVLGGFGWMEFRLDRLENRMNVRMDRIEVQIHSRMDRLEDNVDVKFERVHERLDRMYELLLQMQQQMQQQPPGRQPPPQRPATPQAQDSPEPDDRSGPGGGGRAGEANPDQ